MTSSRKSAMLFGALIADAASLGVHWIYAPDRIAEIAIAQGKTAFIPVDAANYESVPGYFAHAKRQSGMLTQYGEGLLLAIRSLNSCGGLDVAAFQADFTAHFGPGGSYVGYIDRPTRGALDNILAERTPSGIDDDQLPATARLPAILAMYHGKVTLSEMVKSMMQVTNVNAVADAYSDAFTALLSLVLEGELVAAALEAVAATADPTIKAELEDALTTGEPSSTDYAEKTGRACHLPMAGPLSFHILKHSATYQEAVERNNLAGGDSAGRAILIGAVMGSAGTDHIPLEWALKLENGADIWDDCVNLGG